MKGHIETYLKNLEENLLSQEDKTQLYLLFVNCFQVKVKHQSHWHCFSILFVVKYDLMAARTRCCAPKQEKRRVKSSRGKQTSDS